MKFSVWKMSVGFFSSIFGWGFRFLLQYIQYICNYPLIYTNVSGWSIWDDSIIFIQNNVNQGGTYNITLGHTNLWPTWTSPPN